MTFFCVLSVFYLCMPWVYIIYTLLLAWHNKLYMKLLNLVVLIIYIYILWKPFPISRDVEHVLCRSLSPQAIPSSHKPLSRKKTSSHTENRKFRIISRALGSPPWSLTYPMSWLSAYNTGGHIHNLTSHGLII